MPSKAFTAGNLQRVAYSKKHESHFPCLQKPSLLATLSVLAKRRVMLVLSMPSKAFTAGNNASPEDYRGEYGLSMPSKAFTAGNEKFGVCESVIHKLSMPSKAFTAGNGNDR